MKGDIKGFIKNAELKDIYLKSQNVNCNIFPKSLQPSNIALNFDFNFEFNLEDKNKLIVSTISLKVNGIENSSQALQFEIFSEYSLVYSYENYRGEINDELCTEFCKTTALFNAYPYLRESIQTTSCKMGIPPIIAPLLKIEPIQTKNKDNENDNKIDQNKKKHVKKTAN